MNLSPVRILLRPYLIILLLYIVNGNDYTSSDV